MNEIIFLILGLLGLLISSGYVVNYIIYISYYFKISKFILSLFLLAIASDIPELVMTLETSFLPVTQLDQNAHIILGNALGSFFTQGSLLLGLSSLWIYPYTSKRQGLIHGLSLVVSISIFFIMWQDDLIISFQEGVILFLIYFLYAGATIIFYKGSFIEEEITIDAKNVKRSSFLLLKNFSLLVIAIVVIHVCAKLTLDNFLVLVSGSSLSHTTLSFFAFGMGTSLPELAISINAARKGERSISLGNIVGSNIFDILVIPGLAAMIHPLTAIGKDVWYYTRICFFLSLLLLVFLFEKKACRKSRGLFLSFSLSQHRLQNLLFNLADR